MAAGKDNRIVVEVPAGLKQRLYSVLKNRGLTLREWFVNNAHREISIGQQDRQRNAGSKNPRH